MENQHPSLIEPGAMDQSLKETRRGQVVQCGELHDFTPKNYNINTDTICIDACSGLVMGISEIMVCLLTPAGYGYLWIFRDLNL